MKKGLFQKKIWIKGMLGIVACAAVFCMCGFVSEAATGKVTADTAKIRKEASTDSEVVGSTSSGRTVDIVGAVKDASGTVWYKVPNGNNTYGYIRSDLIETNDSIQVSEAPAQNSASSEPANKPEETVPTSIGEMKATISEESIRVRSGASTKHDTVTSLKQGTEITLIGEATDSSGNKWYQMTCEKNGRTINGYVRSDLIAISEVQEENPEGENGEAAEGENPEEITEQPPAEPAEPEHNDYEVVYNEDQYWLYNNIDSTMMKVEDLLTVVNTANENNAALQEQVKSNKIIIIILAVIIVLLVIGVTLLIFKLRDFYYEDYDEDYEEEEEQAAPRRRRPVSDDRYEREEKPVRQQRPAQAGAQRSGQLSQRPSGTAPQRNPQGAAHKPSQGTVQRPAQGNAQKSVSKPELHAAEKMQPEKKAAPRKSQNFLLDDDEFEFEFLNMDDKDL